MYGELFIDLEFVMGITAAAGLLLAFFINQKHQEIQELEKTSATQEKLSQEAAAMKTETDSVPKLAATSISNVESGLGRFTSFISFIILLYVVPISYFILTYQSSPSDDGLGLFLTLGILFLTSAVSFILFVLSAIGLATYKGKKRALKIGLIASAVAAILPWAAYFINFNLIHPGTGIQ
jgi:Flp pilus assembly protein TadB